MDKLLLTDLKRMIDFRSSLLVLPSLDKLLTMANNLNPDEVRVELYKIALDKWHQQYPLVRVQNSRIYNGVRFESNWEELIKNGEDCPNVQLVPTRIMAIESLIGQGRDWTYQDGVLYTRFNGYYNINGVFQRPMYVNYIGPEKELDPLSCIGFIEKRYESKFVDACLLEILFYISQIRKNFEYPDVPIQLFNGLDEAIMELRQQLDQFYMGLSHGKIYTVLGGF